MRQVFWILALLLVAAPVWGADLQVGDLRLLGLSADTLALLGAASVLARALARLEAWRPVIRVELVEPSAPPSSPPAAPASASAPQASGLALVRAAGLALLVLTSGCVSSGDGDGDTAPPEGLSLAVGCQNAPREWGVSWTTAEDLGWIDLYAETPSAETSTTVTEPCGLWLTGLSCDEPVSALGRLYQRLSDLEACAETSNDGAAPYGTCPATFDAILCE